MANRARGGSGGMSFLGGLVFGVMVVLAGLIILVAGGGLDDPVEVAVAPVEEPTEEASDESADAAGTGPEVQEEEPVAVLSPEIAPTDPALPAPVPQPEASVNPSVRATASPNLPAEDGRFTAPEPFETTVSDGQLSGLPPAATLEGPAPTPEIPQVEEPAFELQGPALSINAVPFERRDGAPLVAVVLQDAGASDLTVEALLSLSMPLTLGIAPRDEGDVDLAAEAKLAGYEILAELPVVEGAPGEDSVAISPELSDGDLEARIEQVMSTLWMSIGATQTESTTGEAEGSTGAIFDERLLRGVIAVLGSNGFAFVNGDAESLEAGRALAGAFSVAYAGEDLTITAGADEDQILSTLGSAAERAADEGAVIVTGPANLAMLRALTRWAFQEGSQSVQLAPLSAVIREIN